MCYEQPPNREIDDAFAVLSQLEAGPIVIGPDVTQYEERTARRIGKSHGVAGIYQYRAFALAGGLLSYSGDIAKSHRLGRWLQGPRSKARSRPICPVQPAAKVELIINLKTAKALGCSPFRCR